MNPSELPASSGMPVAHIKSWLAILAGLVVMLAVFTGVQLARGNSDIACFKTLTEEGACTNGSWGAWHVISQSAQGCTTVVQESRTYTGTREVVTGSFNYRTSVHKHCDINWATIWGTNGQNTYEGAVTGGTITYQYAACQIQNDRTRSIVSTTGDCAGTTDTGTVISETNTDTTGAPTGNATSTTGSYQDYLDYVNSRLATTTIVAIPALVRSGETTEISWTGSHVRSCAVVGSNGDSWGSAPQGVGATGATTGDGGGPANNTQNGQQATSGTVYGSHQSSPIRQQTVYTLTCTRAVGAPLVSTVTVNLLPVFQEQ